MSKTKNEVSVVSEEELALLRESFPIIEGGKRVVLPILGMLSKDLTEESGTGKKKTIKVIEAAGTFFKNYDTGDEETGEDGKVKKIWKKDYLGEEIDVIIVFHRRQLRIFDSSLNKFISSPVYDTADQVIPLFLDGREIARGNQEQLQALYPAVSEKGKKTSKLKEEKILYVLYENEMYQVKLTTSSKWAFQDYARKVGPATVVTKIGSIEETFGTNTYRKMTFTNKRLINASELKLIKENQTGLKETVESDRVFFLNRASIESKADKDFDALPGVEAKKGKDF